MYLKYTVRTPSTIDSELKQVCKDLNLSMAVLIRNY